MGADEQPRREPSRRAARVGEISATPVGSIHPGHALSSRYELMGRLGLGGMAELYLARAVGIGEFEKVVVLKRILGSRAEDPDFVRMFEDEARVAATLEHPHIVTTHDIGRDGDDVFFTMEYLHGENVKRIIAAARQVGEPMPIELALQIAIGCAAGLHHAHEQRAYSGEPLDIVHRDVSPSNIIVTYQSGVKLIDFGIAKASSAKHITEVGVVKGKASYMSPEQCRGEAVDRRSDVFSLGIALYEMLTLARPFTAPEPLAVLAKIVHEEPVPPSHLREGLPPALERVVMRALAKRADDRHPSAFVLQEHLELVMREHKLHALPGALGRYLEHLFGAKPYPWAQHYRVTPPALPEWSRPREPDSLITTPRQRIDEGTAGPGERSLQVVTEPSRLGASPSPQTEAGTAAAAQESAGEGVAPTQSALAAASASELGFARRDEVVLVQRGRGGIVLVAAATLAAVVAGAWWLGAPRDRSGEPTRAPIAVAGLESPSSRELEPIASTEVATPVVPATQIPETAAPIDPAPAAVAAPTTALAEITLAAPAEAAAAPSGPARARADEKERRREAARLLARAQGLVFSDPKQAGELARRAAALSPSQDAWSVVGVAACRQGDRANALRAHTKLRGQRQSVLERTCRAKGVVLGPAE